MKWLAAGVLVFVVAIAGIGLIAAGRPGQASPGASIEIRMTEMRFSPNRLDLRAGESVTIRLVNSGAQRHDLAFPARGMPGLLGLETNLEPGQTTTFRLKFDEPGTYVFECTLPGHAVAGMTGAAFVR